MPKLSSAPNKQARDTAASSLNVEATRARGGFENSRYLECPKLEPLICFAQVSIACNGFSLSPSTRVPKRAGFKVHALRT